MPLYDYSCESCGAFRHWGSLATAVEPQPCPACGQLSARTIASPHMRYGKAVNRYKAEAYNERSANEPRVVQHFGDMGSHSHRDGHKHHEHKHARKQIRQSHRPWMVGH